MKIVQNENTLRDLPTLTLESFHLHSRYIVQILVHSHFDLVNLLLAVEAPDTVSELVFQMAVELTNIHLVSVQQKRLV